jgi:hypothetical protein
MKLVGSDVAVRESVLRNESLGTESNANDSKFSKLSLGSKSGKIEIRTIDSVNGRHFGALPRRNSIILELMGPTE